MDCTPELYSNYIMLFFSLVHDQTSFEHLRQYSVQEFIEKAEMIITAIKAAGCV